MVAEVEEIEGVAVSQEDSASSCRSSVSDETCGDRERVSTVYNCLSGTCLMSYLEQIRWRQSLRILHYLICGSWCIKYCFPSTFIFLQ